MTLRASRAEARARHKIASDRYRREQTLRRWDREGRIKILSELDPDGGSKCYYTVMVGDQYMRGDGRAEWPSEGLVARVALAVEAGQGFAPSIPEGIMDFHMGDPARMTPVQWARLKP